MSKLIAIAAAALAVPALAAAAPGQNPVLPEKAPGAICRNVVTADKGAKPFRLCMTKAEWAAKEKADAKNPNRLVCRYEQASYTRFKSHKICMTSAEWETQRQLERQQIDRIQRGACVRGAGC